VNLLPRRWHFWACFPYGDEAKIYKNYRRQDRFAGPELVTNGSIEKRTALFKAAREMLRLHRIHAFESKIFAPLPQHKDSGHVHLVVLATKDELLKTGGPLV
jgi:hypothetical protein